jgi:hypothetical protein
MHAAFLAECSPSSSITTIDLDPNDHRFRNATGQRSDGEPNDPTIVRFRNDLLCGYPNVRQIPMNSLELLSMCKNHLSTFDLIWVDGDHHFPIVAIDIAMSLLLIRGDGLVVVDDVRPDQKGADQWVGPDASLTVDALQLARLCTVTLIHKRLKAKHLVSEKRRRYIAVLRPEGMGSTTS